MMHVFVSHSEPEVSHHRIVVGKRAPHRSAPSEIESGVEDPVELIWHHEGGSVARLARLEILLKTLNDEFAVRGFGKRSERVEVAADDHRHLGVKSSEREGM